MVQRRRGDARDDGFTIIELMVVMTIIGILVAITVPSYQGIQDNVKQSATQSDLTSNRTALVEYSIDNNGGFPAASGFNPTGGTSDLTGYGWSQSAETTGYHYATNSAGSAWCLDMTSSTGAVYRITTNSPTGGNGPTATGLCSALASSSY